MLLNFAPRPNSTQKVDWAGSGLFGRADLGTSTIIVFRAQKWRHKLFSADIFLFSVIFWAPSTITFALKYLEQSCLCFRKTAVEWAPLCCSNQEKAAGAVTPWLQEQRMAAATAASTGPPSVSFSGVRVANISEDGATTPKFPHTITVVAEYDPEVRQRTYSLFWVVFCYLFVITCSYWIHKDISTSF